jgi:hypothetical protein
LNPAEIVREGRGCCHESARRKNDL